MTPQRKLTESDFVTLEAALSETERGRLFLAEVARRRRAEDAARILSALERLEARATRNEGEQTRRRQESERATEVLRQLAEALRDLRASADARARASAASRGEEDRPAEPRSALEQRFAALVALDGPDLDGGVKRFG